MDALRGKRVNRNSLFEQDDSSSNKRRGDDAMDISDEDNQQDFATFERMMEARVKAQMGEDTTPSTLAITTTNDDKDDSADSSAEDNNTPVFRMFAGSGPVKIETEPIEPEYIQTKRPEVSMEESDTEEHWNALASAAIDADKIKEMAQIPLPAMRYPKRIMHIKLETESPDTKASGEKSKGEKGTKQTKNGEDGDRRKPRRRSEPYRRVLSPYNGGVIKARMLEDVIREEEKAASEALARSLRSGRGGRGGNRGGMRGSGGRGRGRGRS
ncbi:hypothetical protein BX661DRAFT_168196 [Kickxella alabastrina]|uniref:uncharacterized protein n=1 Tax=Kickxella alabastrina TaxID=61397 RepID=UPI00221F618E|nr:uncharacterized protein BX661DRAFT_168196 [Kickxella alabastrina]KAI7835019.1 hypothetical protein BX661DRAFT_168196 [Kickxella alabastrina]KAJ1947648.1 hypothetical protein GGF37_000231 [Kickxella alabastrina]